MKRREMLKTAVAAAASYVSLGYWDLAPEPRYRKDYHVKLGLADEAKLGYVDWQRAMIMRNQGANIRAFVDGEDVTDHCRAADDIEGYAEVYRVRNGRHYLDGDRVAMEVRRGQVEFRRVL
jgi:hypothetical protein